MINKIDNFELPETYRTFISLKLQILLNMPIMYNCVIIIII